MEKFPSIENPVQETLEKEQRPEPTREQLADNLLAFIDSEESTGLLHGQKFE